MKTLTIAALTLAITTTASAQNQTTFRDASGQITGTVSTDSNGSRHSAMARAAPPALLRETATAPQRSVMLTAAPLAQPQRLDAERRSRMSRTSTLSGSSLAPPIPLAAAALRFLTGCKHAPNG